MKTILVDDMLLDLQLFELKCADMPDFEIVGKFTDPNAAIEYAAGHVVDFALLDIDMPGMDGIHLAQALRRLRSDIIIVFATAHPKFAVEALKMKADYIIFKPFDREDIADVMERAKLLRRRQCKRIHFHTFGAFDMLVDGEPVHFRSGKAKDRGKKVAGKPMEFRSSAGLRISVGKNNSQNDQLTTKQAFKSDIWLHTQKIHGSHVILWLEGGEADAQSLTEAAVLAAYFSQGREGRRVPVDYTPVKYVKKPAGARPGMVVYTTYQTAYVDPDGELVKKLRVK